MDIVLYVTDQPERVITGSSLALNLPNDEERQIFLEVISETLEASVIQMKNGDHIVVKKIRKNR